MYLISSILFAAELKSKTLPIFDLDIQIFTLGSAVNVVKVQQKCALSLSHS